MTDARPPDAVLDAATNGGIVETTHYESRESYGTWELVVADRSGPLVLKSAPTDRAGWRLRKEAAVLRAVADVEGVPVPAVSAVGAVDTDDGSRTYLVTAKCEGVTARELLDEAPHRAPDVLRSLGRALASLHDGPSFARCGGVVAGPDVRRLELDDAADRWSETLRDLLTSERAILRDTAFEPLATRALDVLDRRAEDLALPTAPSLLHSDPNLGNVFVADGAVSALIDWEYAKAGDPAYDLAAVEYRTADVLGVDGAADALRAGYRAVRRLPAGFERRRPVYRALFPINRMVALCGGSEAETGDPDAATTSEGRALRREARRRFDRLAASR